MVKKLATNFHNWTMGVYDEQLVGAQNQQLVESGLSYAKNIVSDNRGSLYPRQGTKPLMRLAEETVMIPYTVGGEKCFMLIGHNGIRLMRYDNKTLLDPISSTTSYSSPTFTSTKNLDYWQSADSAYGFKCAISCVGNPYEVNYINANYSDPFANANVFDYYRLWDSWGVSEYKWYGTPNVLGKTSILYFKNNSSLRRAAFDLCILYDSWCREYIQTGGSAYLTINSVKGLRADGTWEDVSINVSSINYYNGIRYTIKTPQAEYSEYSVSFTISGQQQFVYGTPQMSNVPHYGYNASVAIAVYVHNIEEYSGFNTTFLAHNYSGDLTKIQYAQSYEDMIIVGDKDYTPQQVSLTGTTLSIGNFSPTGISFSTTGNPSAVDIYQNRIVLSAFGNRDYQQMVALSEFSNTKKASSNFTVPNPPTATSALELYQNKMRYPITQIYSGDKALYVFSVDGISYITDIGTTSSPTFKIRNYEKAGSVKPIVKDDVLIYTDNTREKIYMVDYDLLVERYKVFDISAISKNLLSKKIKEMYYLPNRERMIYILFDDGTLCAFLFDNNLNMRGFYPIETNGIVYDVCVHPDADELFLVVGRANNYYIETIEARPFINYNHSGNDDYQKNFLTWMGNNTRFIDFESRDMWRNRIIYEDGLFFQYNADNEYLIPADITDTYNCGAVTDGTIDDTYDCGLVTDSTISDTSDNGTIGELVTDYSAIMENCTNAIYNAMEVGKTYLFFDGQTPDKTKGTELTLLQKLWGLDGTTAIFVFEESLEASFLYPACIKKTSYLENQPQLLYWDGTSATPTIDNIIGSSDLVLSYQVILDGMYIGDYNCSYEAGTPFINHPDFEGYFHRIGLKYEKHAKMSYVAPMVDQKIISEMSIYLLNTQDIDVGVNGGFQNVTKFCTDGFYDYPNRLYQGEYSLVVDNNTESRKDVEIKTEQPFGFEVLAITAVTDYGDFGGN